MIAFLKNQAENMILVGETIYSISFFPPESGHFWEGHFLQDTFCRALLESNKMLRENIFLWLDFWILFLSVPSFPAWKNSQFLASS